jgi:hypothetical protein
VLLTGEFCTAQSPPAQRLKNHVGREGLRREGDQERIEDAAPAPVARSTCAHRRAMIASARESSRVGKAGDPMDVGPLGVASLSRLVLPANVPYPPKCGFRSARVLTPIGLIRVSGVSFNQPTVLDPYKGGSIVCCTSKTITGIFGIHWKGVAARRDLRRATQSSLEESK